MHALCTSAYVCVHIRASTLVYVHVQVCTLYASAFVVVQKIKCPDASKHKLDICIWMHLLFKDFQDAPHTAYVYMCVLVPSSSFMGN